MREKIKLVSTAGTGHFYTTTKNKRLHPDKMEVRKFDPKVRKHQAAYIRRVVDTLNDLDNVLYEVTNEGGAVFAVRLPRGGPHSPRPDRGVAEPAGPARIAVDVPLPASTG